MTMTTKRVGTVTAALAATAILAGCGGGGGGGGGGVPQVQPGAPGSPGTSPTPSEKVRVLGHDIDVIHLEKTDSVGWINDRKVRFATENGYTDYGPSPRGTYRFMYTCPGTPPAGNVCRHERFGFDNAPGAPSYRAREAEPDDELGDAVAFLPKQPAGFGDVNGEVMRGDLSNIYCIDGSGCGDSGQITEIRLFRNDSAATLSRNPGTGRVERADSVQNAYGGYGEWMVFYSVGPKDPGSRVSRVSGFVGGTAFGNLYVDPSGDSRPKQSQGNALWRGHMVGREAHWNGARPVRGSSVVTYDFGDNTVDVELADIAYADSGRAAIEPRVSWTGLPALRDASFFIPGHGNHAPDQNPHPSRGYVDGDFYGPQAEEVAGVFETRRGMVGAFGGKRE